MSTAANPPGLPPGLPEDEDPARLRILAVDDDDSLVQMLNLIYGGSHQIDRAATLREAEEILQVRSYDVLILDVHLPDGLGVTLLRRSDEAAYRAKRQGGDQVIECES